MKFQRREMLWGHHGVVLRRRSRTPPQKSDHLTYRLIYGYPMVHHQTGTINHCKSRDSPCRVCVASRWLTARAALSWKCPFEVHCGEHPFVSGSSGRSRIGLEHVIGWRSRKWTRLTVASGHHLLDSILAGLCIWVDSPLPIL